jgi:alkylhydroperoxidase family enzyme
MHWKDARHAGETEQSLYGLSAWREAPYYSERERAALELVEAVTRLGEHGVTDEVYAAAAAQFDSGELGSLIMAIVVINAWNRIAITTRMTPGTYEPGT